MDEEAHPQVNHFPELDGEDTEDRLVNENEDATLEYEESDSERENENIDYGNDSEEEEHSTNSNGFVDTSEEQEYNDMPELISIHGNTTVQPSEPSSSYGSYFPVSYNPAQPMNYNISIPTTSGGSRFYSWTIINTGEMGEMNMFHYPGIGDSMLMMDSNVIINIETPQQKKVKKCLSLLYLEKEKKYEDLFELEIPENCIDPIICEEFKKGDEIYILDDCFTNFFKFETLEQMFNTQQSVLNPFNQLPIERILKFKAL